MSHKKWLKFLMSVRQTELVLSRTLRNSPQSMLPDPIVFFDWCIETLSRIRGGFTQRTAWLCPCLRIRYRIVVRCKFSREISLTHVPFCPPMSSVDFKYICSSLRISGMCSAGTNSDVRNDTPETLKVSSSNDSLTIEHLQRPGLEKRESVDSIGREC